MSQELYKVVGGSGGRCSCGHLQRRHEAYYLIDTQTSAYTLCEHCGKMEGMDRWWGSKKEITADEMEKRWFGSVPTKETICQQLRQYTRKLREPSRRREELLESAVEV